MIKEIACKLGLNESEVILFNNDIAKVKKMGNKKNSNLILVTSITPTKYGEGKTTLVIGINDALNKIGKKSIAVLREPSMGPTFGQKGGACGGGKAKIIPENDINLFFTGDFSRITIANNLIASLIDNHIYHGNELDIKEITFNRCIDLCDRSLRNILINNIEYHFDITAASEIMGIMTLCNNNLKEKIESIIIGYNSSNKPIYFKELNATNAIIEILKDATYPNLVRSLENNPVFVHMGPFANISVGCNSIISTKYALSLSDYTVLEAGFGSDLGCEKFFDIICKNNDINPSLIVLNVTIRALKEQGSNSLIKGLDNLNKHIDNIKCFKNNILVVLNKFEDDKNEEINIIKSFVNNLNLPFDICESYLEGSDGSINIAKKIINLTNNDKSNFLYNDTDDVQNKINKICKKMYHVDKVIYKDKVLKKIENIKNNNLDKLPICISKSPLTLNGNKNKDLDYIEITDVKVNNGAGYIIVYSGNVNTMPGLPINPKACQF